MRKQNIIICDRDEAYVQALSTYFFATIRGARITSYSDPDIFSMENGYFDIALLSDDFIKTVESVPGLKERLGKVFLLTGDINASSEDYTVLYKFQRMTNFMESIMGEYASRSGESMPSNERWTGIFSPMRHELQLPFSLACCHYMHQINQDKRLLFLDLEDNSLFADLTGLYQTKNVTDYLYLLENDSVTNEELESCISSYQGFSCLAPVKYIQELAAVSNLRWERFFDSISRLGYQQIVVLFDASMRGIEELFSHLSDLLLLGRDGDYYRKYERQIYAFLNDHKQPMSVHQAALPLSGMNLNDGTYQFEQLLAGNLSSYARAVVEGASGAR